MLTAAGGFQPVDEAVVARCLAPVSAATTAVSPVVRLAAAVATRQLELSADFALRPEIPACHLVLPQPKRNS